MRGAQLQKLRLKVRPVEIDAAENGQAFGNMLELRTPGQNKSVLDTTRA